MTVAKTSRLGDDEKLFLCIVVALAVIAGTGSWIAAAVLFRRDAPRAISPDKPRQLVDFSLTDRTGRIITGADVQDKILVVSFLFTGCAVSCPEVSKCMAEIQQLTADQPEVRLLSLTVDPRTDTPPVLAKWGSHYGADTNRWYLLTGRKDVLYKLIGASFLATDPNDPFNYMPGGFVGTDRIAVVDRHGHLRAFFDGLQAATPDAVAAEINQLRKEN